MSSTFDPEMFHHGLSESHQLTETDPYITPTLNSTNSRPPGSDLPTPIFSSSVGVHMLVPLFGGWPPLPPRTVFSRRAASWRSSRLPPPTVRLTEPSCSQGAASPVHRSLRSAVHVRERQFVGGDGGAPELTLQPAASAH